MIVVSDNGPIGFLIQIGQAELLPRLYQEVLVPPAAMRELRDTGTPEVIRRWIADAPSWLREESPNAWGDAEGPGAGKREAIQLAKEMGALLLCDDRAAVNHARREGLLVTGTLGILQLAHEREWIDIETEIGHLRAGTAMHLPERLIPLIDSRAELIRRDRSAQ